MVAVCGGKNSGKSTLARYVVNRLLNVCVVMVTISTHFISTNVACSGFFIFDKRVFIDKCSTRSKNMLPIHLNDSHIRF